MLWYGKPSLKGRMPKTSRKIIEIGEDGLDQSWQEEFEPAVDCVHCGGEARIAFVYKEASPTKKGEKLVVDLHHNDPKGDGFWPHDAVAVAVYFCKDCLEPTAKFNQA